MWASLIVHSWWQASWWRYSETLEKKLQHFSLKFRQAAFLQDQQRWQRSKEYLEILWHHCWHQLRHVSVAIESRRPESGAHRPHGPNLISEIGRRIADVTHEPRSTVFLRQRISVAVQRGVNAACINGTLTLRVSITQKELSLTWAISCVDWYSRELYKKYNNITSNDPSESIQYFCETVSWRRIRTSNHSDKNLH